VGINEAILNNLEPYNGTERKLVSNQDTNDIIKLLLKNHETQKKEYDKILGYFIGSDAETTAYNVFKYLKNNVKYIPESETKQYIKSPAAIVATGKTLGSDCKNYSSFINGILDAYRRLYNDNFDIAYRFASYDAFDNTPTHVFSVLNPATKKEIWIDPVLDFFNKRKNPYFYTDKKIKNMAIMALNGLDDADIYVEPRNIPSLKDLQVPTVLPVRQPTLKRSDLKGPSDFGKIADLLGSGAISDLISGHGIDFEGGIELGAEGAATAFFGPQAGVAAGKIVKTIENLFGAKDDPSGYWKAWKQQDADNNFDVNSSVQWWIMTDGDSVSNEAANIVSYIKQYGLNIFNQSQHIYQTLGRYATVNDLITKLQRGGQSEVAQQLQQYLQKSTTNMQKSTTNILPSETQKAGISTLLIIGLIGAGLYMFTKK
jgi:hypothetical protein